MATLTTNYSCEGIDCIKCKYRDLFHDPATGDLICRTTGLIISEREINLEISIVKNKEGRLEQTSKIVGPLSPFTGYTVFNPKENIFQDIQHQSTQNLKRAAKQNFISWEHARLIKANKEIERIADLLEIPKNVIQFIAIIFKKIAKEDYLRGRKIHLIVAALYSEILQYYPIRVTLKQLLDVSNVTNINEYRTCRKNINRFLKQKNLIPEALRKSLSENRVINYAQNMISQYAFQLELSQDLIFPYLKFIQKYALHFRANSAKGIAAGVIYIAAKNANKHLCQTTIAKLLDVNEITLRNNFRIIQAIIQRITKQRQNKIPQKSK